MNNVNEITISKENYEDDFEFEWAIKDAIMMLLKNDYIMTVQYDYKQMGIVTIQYNLEGLEWGYDCPYWLSPEEIEQVNVDVKGE